MPANAPIPDGIAHLEVDFDIVGRTSSIGRWFFVPGYAAADGAWAESFLQAYFFDVAGEWLSCMHSDCYLRAGQLVLQGVRYVTQWPGERGAHDGGEANGTTLTLHWIGVDPRISARALTHLPACPTSFIRDYEILSPTALPALATAGENALAAEQALTDPLGGSVVPIAVRRRTQTGPLPVALWTPLVAVTPGFRVSTMRRRLPASRRVPPSIE